MPYKLAYKDRYFLAENSAITGDTSDSIPFASIPDDVPTKIAQEWTGRELTKLLSSVMIGAELMFPDEAQQIIWTLLKGVHKPITLEDEEDNCINYPPSTPILVYEPQNPFNQPDFVPEDYLVPPFKVNTSFEYPEIFGYLATDVMVVLDAIPVFSDWLEVLGLSWPTIKIRVNGQGQIELDLLSVALGGYAIIKVGSPPNILDLIDGIIETGVVVVDLGQDLSAIPPESDLVVSEEINIDVLEPTDVYIVFLPKIDISTEFFGFGGGIRQIGLCGFEETPMLGYVEDVRWNDTDYLLEQRKNGIYEPVADFDIVLAFIQDAFDKADNAQSVNASQDSVISDLDIAITGLYTWKDTVAQPTLDDHGERLDDIEALQATHDTSIANLATRMDTAESDIDALDARLDLLEAKQLWSVHYDFKASENGFGGGSGVSWASTVGYSWSTSPIIIAKTDSSFLDGRIGTSQSGCWGTGLYSQGSRRLVLLWSC
jgi:hypothetical protein